MGSLITQIDIARNKIVNAVSDLVLQLSIQDVNNTSVDQATKDKIIASLNEKPLKNEPKFIGQISGIVTQIYNDVSNSLTNSAIVSIPNIITNVEYSILTGITLTRETVTGRVIF